MIEETKEIETKRNNLTWEERIETKINILFEELVNLIEKIDYIEKDRNIERLKKETKELEYQLKDKNEIISCFANRSICDEKWNKLDHFRNIK